MTSNAVATKDPVMGIVSAVESGIAQALPSHVTTDAFLRALQTSLRTNPRLPECTKQSLSAAIMSSAQFGLTIGYTAHLVPYGKECTLIIDYKGLIDMAYRNERVRKIMADCICEMDEFEYSGFGRPVHKKNLRQRGKEYAAYAYCELDGCADPIVVVMSNEEIEKVRKSSKASGNGPWVQWWGEMAKKTCIKRLCKIIPKSIELQSALEFEERQEAQVREVDAEVVNPLAPGRHTRQRRQAPPAIEAPSPEEQNAEEVRREALMQQAAQMDRPAAWDQLSRAYDTHPELVDKCIEEVGLPVITTLDWQTMSEDELKLLTRAAAKFAKEISK